VTIVRARPIGVWASAAIQSDEFDAVVAGADHGDWVQIHAAACPVTASSAAARCKCTPMALYVGAEA
jgi:hypothetical protein